MSAVTEPNEAVEFKAWPKIPRLSKSLCIVTEKIDGTNAAIHIGHDGILAVQSRNRFIKPGEDNYGFAAWVHENAETLARDLGGGIHFGEWWGAGIGPRGYSQTERWFSLFNTRWTPKDGFFETPRLRVVPILAQGFLADKPWEAAMNQLRESGSVAMPGHRNPEGVVVFSSDANHLWKILNENDDRHKGQVDVTPNKSLRLRDEKSTGAFDGAAMPGEGIPATTKGQRLPHRLLDGEVEG